MKPTLPAGLLTALVFAGLMVVAFAVATAATTMPTAERWAALTTFSLIAFAYTLQGSAGVYDALGRAIRRDMRSLVVLLALFPALYTSYSLAVDEFVGGGLLTAVAFVAVPAVALLRSAGTRMPTLLDAVGVLYLWLSLRLALVPDLTLPQQGGVVGFFALGSTPLLLLLLAARGWPGIGFTWFLNSRDLLIALLAAAVAVLVLTPIALAAGLASLAPTTPSAITLMVRAAELFFFVALPAEILFRGVLLNGVERLLTQAGERRGGKGAQRTSLAAPRAAALVLGALLYAAAQAIGTTQVFGSLVVAALAGLAYGWVYQRTGKVSASAVTHLLVVWCWSVFFMS